jgi:ABC-type sugar transport system permease subunit
MSFGRRLAGAYADILRAYWAWMPSLLILAVLVFVPLGLVDALSFQVDVESLDPTSGIEIAALMLAVGAVTMTGLLGEIFFSGAIAISLTHPHDQDRPGLREIAGRIKYGRLIVVDVAFVAIVALGLLLGLVPGVLAFVFLGLAGPIVEIEERSPGSALRRSFELVRGSFWLVFWVMVPIEVIGDAVGGGLAALVHHQLGDTFLAAWLAEAVGNAVLSPMFALAAVLLTVELIAHKEGAAPPLHATPVPA